MSTSKMLKPLRMIVKLGRNPIFLGSGENMQVRKQKFRSWQEALAFAQQKLNEGYANIRIITAKSKLASRYGIQGEEVQVRFWR